MEASLHHKGSQATEILDLFLSIRPTEIKRDLKSLARRADELRKLEAAFEKSPVRHSAAVAASLHRRFLLGINLIRNSMLPKDAVTFIVTLAAHEVAELACSTASGRGQLFELGRLIERLEEAGNREQAAVEVMLSNSLIARVHDMIFVEILTRYGLSNYARLYEDYRAQYDVSCEVGRRLISRNPVTRREHERIVSHFVSLHGPKVGKKLVSRLESNGLFPESP